MRKVLLLIAMLPLFCAAQSPVINSAPQKWLKWGRFAGSLFSDSAMVASDSSKRVPNTEWVKQRISTAGGSYVPTTRLISTNGSTGLFGGGYLSSNLNFYIDTTILSTRARLAWLYAPINNATFTGITNASLFRIAQSGYTSDGMGRISVTLAPDGNNYAYFSMTRKTGIIWAHGISNTNDYIIGDGPGRDIGSTIPTDSVRFRMDVYGNVTLKGTFKSQHLVGVVGTDSIGGIDGSGRSVRFAPNAFVASVAGGYALKDSTFNINKNGADILNASTFRNNLGVLGISGSITPVATIADLQAYTGTSTNLWVADTVRGGPFKYVASGTPNYYTTFPAALGGIWQRPVSGNIYYLQWADVSPLNTARTNLTNTQRMLYDVPRGSTIIGDRNKIIVIDSSLYINKKLTIDGFNLKAKINPLVTTAQLQHLFRIITDSVSIVNSNFDGSSGQVVDDTKRFSAMQFTFANYGRVQNCTGVNIRKNFIEQNNSNFGKFINNRADSVYRDGVSLVHASHNVISGLTINKSLTGGGGEDSDSSSYNYHEYIFVSKAVYCWDIDDDHNVNDRSSNGSFNYMTSDSCANFMFHIAINRTSLHFTFDNITINRSYGANGNIYMGNIADFSYNNITITNPLHSTAQVRFANFTGLTLKGFTFKGTQAQTLFRLNTGTNKGLTMAGNYADSCASSAAAITLVGVTNANIYNNNFSGYGSQSGYWLDIGTTAGLKIHDNNLAVTTALYGINYNPSGSSSDFQAYNNTIANATAIRLNGTNYTTYYFSNTGVISKSSSGTPIFTTLPYINLFSLGSDPATVSGNLWNNTGIIKYYDGTNTVRLAKQTDVAGTANQIAVYNSAGNAVPTTTLPTATLPPFTNDVTSSAGNASLTIGANKVTYGKIQASSAINRLMAASSTTAFGETAISGTQGVSTTWGAGTLSIGLGAITPTSTNGVSAATMAFMDATSSVQTQLNTKGVGTVTGGSITWPGALYTTPTTGTVSSGTLTFAPALATQSANTVFAGPTTGAAATPTFRALVAADIPSLSATYPTLAGNNSFTGRQSIVTNDIVNPTLSLTNSGSNAVALNVTGGQAIFGGAVAFNAPALIGSQFRITSTGFLGFDQGAGLRFNNLAATNYIGITWSNTSSNTAYNFRGDISGDVAVTTDATGYIVNATTTALSSATLNATYPDVSVGYRVICYNITGAPAIYIKATEAGGSDIWLTALVTTTP